MNKHAVDPLSASATHQLRNLGAQAVMHRENMFAPRVSQSFSKIVRIFLSSLCKSFSEKMSFLPHLRKIRKLKRTKPSTIEDEVAKALYDLEMNHKTLRTSLPRFHINTAKEIEYGAGEKRGLIVFYPLRFLMLVRKIQKVLVAELEKKFAGRVVVLVAQRKIVRRPKDVYSLQAVQRSRTQTAVNENILTDLLYPCDIVGRRWKCRVDGSKLMKVYLDSRDRKKCEGRLRIVADIFKRLTHRPVSFGFMWNPKLQQVAH